MFEKPPYMLTREEFNYYEELYHPDCASQSRYIKGRNGKLEQHLKILSWLSFGVHEWLYNKALKGCEESLFKISHSYNLYDEVLNKAKEQGLM